MKVINGKDIAWDDNINFDIKVIDIDFYNSTNRTLFLGHTGDDKSTLVHLVIPTEHGSNNNVYMSIKSDSGVTSTVIPKYINNNEYYFSITKDFTNISSKGYIQFFVRDTNSNDELVVIAASNKIPYIIDEALEINIIEPSEEEEIGLLEQAINSIQSLMSSKANVADVYRKNEVYSKTEADTLLSSKANKGTTLSEYGITDTYTQEEVDNILTGKMSIRSDISNIDNCIRNGTIYRVVIGQQNGINEYATLICVQGPGFDAQRETMTQFGFTNLGRFVRRRRINGVWENGFTDLINVNT